MRVEAHHDARLIIERPEIALNTQICGECFACRKAQEMSAIAIEALMGFAPEIRGLVREDPQVITLCRPSLRFI
jgi:hypothetical protein